MNLKPLLSLLGTILLLGCGTELPAGRMEAQFAPSLGHEPTAQSREEEHPPHGVEFREGRGLTVPPWTRQTLGIKIADVHEGPATRRIELPLRVFKAQESARGKTAFVASGSVDREDAAHLKQGTEISLRLPNGADTAGEILAIRPASAQLTGLAEVIVKLPASEQIQIGSFLDGHAAVTTREDVALIPKEALLKTAEGYFVYVVNGSSLFRTKIGVGGQEGPVVEVTEGLYSGDRVVLKPVMPLWLAELQAIRGGKACADGH